MGLTGAVASVFRNYANFRGRATRSEYWWWVLARELITLAALAGGYALLQGQPFNADGTATPLQSATLIGVFVITFALLIPSLAVLVRRLHDSDSTGLLVLLGFVPFGWIFVLVLTLRPGTHGANRYGPDPRRRSARGDAYASRAPMPVGSRFGGSITPGAAPGITPQAPTQGFAPVPAGDGFATAPAAHGAFAQLTPPASVEAPRLDDESTWISSWRDEPTPQPMAFEDADAQPARPPAFPLMEAPPQQEAYAYPEQPRSFEPQDYVQPADYAQPQGYPQPQDYVQQQFVPQPDAQQVPQFEPQPDAQEQWPHEQWPHEQWPQEPGPRQGPPPA